MSIETLLIAEKPSLAEAIALALGEMKGVRAVKNAAAACWEVGDARVTWLFGHMFEQAEPEDYDERYKKWRRSDLPIVPSAWRLKPAAGKAPHIKAIGSLLKQARTVWNCGDAAREGQLLVDELLAELGRDPFGADVKRLWVKSYTRKDMVAAIRAAFPNAEKRRLHQAALCRQRADWLVGMNLSRDLTLKARAAGHDISLSVGRVQSPTLKLVVDRDLEIETFKPVGHFLPWIDAAHAGGTFRATWMVPDEGVGIDPAGRVVDRAVAEAVAAKVRSKAGSIADYAVKDRSEPQPLAYSLSALQKECSSKFGLTAAETLQVAQDLYEKHKATTYPRSDSRHLPTSILKDEAGPILKALGQVDSLSEVVQGADLSVRSPTWDDGKVSDHHGIIPTVEISAARIEAMSDVEQKVFFLIAKAFVAQFYPPHRFKSVAVVVSVEGEKFKAVGRCVIDTGWKVVYGADAAPEEDAGPEGTVDLPDMKAGDAVEAAASGVESKRTSPPPRFTDGSLIDAMAHIHRFVQDAEIRKRLKETSGIGTEATRAGIIEILVKRGYIRRKGKQIVSTTEGRAVSDAIVAAAPAVADPGMTGLWEQRLGDIEAGELEADRFLAGVEKMVRGTIASGDAIILKGVAAKAEVEPLPGDGTRCPQCGEGTMHTRQSKDGKQIFLGCDRYPECKHTVWPERKLEPLKGDGDACPKCSSGRKSTKPAKEGKRFLVCSSDCGWKDFPAEGGWDKDRAKGGRG